MYTRAVIKPAPREFTVEVLCPSKQGEHLEYLWNAISIVLFLIGNHFSYGVRVCPVVRSQGSSDSRSTSSDGEYDIWRRWEDCLDFQDTLEDEYSKLSRQKVKILKRWASGKKRPEEMDSPYRSRNAAASFESLPEGPDPREVAMDVHKMVPALSRKGFLFRVGRSTLKQRGDEFAAMIQALFNPSPDAPVLLQELRNCSSIRDFFAFWRRDNDLLKRAGKDVPRLRRSNSNLSVLSLSNFSFKSFSTAPDSPAVPVFPRATFPAAFLRHSMFSRTVTDLHEEAPHSGSSSAPPATRQFVSDATTNLTPSGSPHHCPPTVATEAMMFTDELLLEDEPSPMVRSVPQRRVLPHGPVPQSSRFVAQSQTPQFSITRAPYQIPEDELNTLPRPQARPRRDSSTTPGNRNARLFIPAPSSELGIAEQAPHYSPVNQRPNIPPSSPPLTQRTLHTDFASPASTQSSSHSRSVSSVPSSISMSRFSVTSSISSYTQASWRSSSHGSEFSDDSESCPDPEIAFTNPSSIPHTTLSEIAEHDFEPGLHSRASASSFASIHTETSADGVLPHRLHPYTASSRARSSTLPLDAQTQSPISEGEDLLDNYCEFMTYDYLNNHTTVNIRFWRRCRILQGKLGQGAAPYFRSQGKGFDQLDQLQRFIQQQRQC